MFSDFYNKYREGIVHHLSMEIDNYDDLLNFLKSKDIKIIQSGCFQDKIRYSYFSTNKDLNFIVEIVEKNKVKLIL